MTENEAIEWLKAISATQKESIHTSSLLNRKEALHIAIQSLEEIQQYRETGMTAEQIKDMQTDYCAKGVVLEEYKAIGTVKEIENALQQLASEKYELRKFYEIGTLDQCREAVEKMKPKKPIRQCRGVYDDDSGDWIHDEEWYMCPTCKIRNEVYKTWTSCRYCNQRLLWEE